MARVASPAHLGLLIFCIFAGIKTLYGLNNLETIIGEENDTSWLNFTWFPSSFDNLTWKRTSPVHFVVHSEMQADVMPAGQICVISEDTSIVVVQNNSLNLQDILTVENLNITKNNSLILEGVFLGRTRLKLFSRIEDTPDGGVSNFLKNFTQELGTTNYSITNDELYSHCGVSDGESWRQLPDSYDVAVVRPDRIADKIFLGFVMLLVVVSNIGMGCKIELAVVMEVMKKPIAPVIGFCCQFLIMPLAAFGFAKAFGLSGGVALGFFATGCAPGGGSSNMYTFLLNGDVSLSVTMTLISIVASIGMIPFWMFTLGRLFLEEHGIKIPYQNIVFSMIAVLIPIGIGLLIQWKKPKAAQFIVKKILRVWFIIVILFFFTFGIWSNQYVFQMITPSIIIAGCILPYTGFLLSGLAAFVLRQPLNRVLTIAIETGIQNTGIPILLMKFTLPQPEGDMSIVGPVMVAMFTPLPLWIAVTVSEIRKRCCKRDSKDVKFDDLPQNDVETPNGGLLEKNPESDFRDDDEPTFAIKQSKTNKEPGV